MTATLSVTVIDYVSHSVYQRKAHTVYVATRPVTHSLAESIIPHSSTN